MILGTAPLGTSIGYTPERFYAPLPDQYRPTGQVYEPNYSDERVYTATRTITISVLPGQALEVKISASLTADLNTVWIVSVNGTAVNLDEWTEIDVEAGTQDIIIEYQATVRGYQPIIESPITAEIRLTPTATLDDELETYDGTVSSITRESGPTRKAVSFNGTTDYISLPDYGFRGADERAVFLYLKSTSVGPFLQLSTDVHFEINSAGKPAVVVDEVEYVLEDSLINDGQWHALTASYDGSAWTGIVDEVSGSPQAVTVDSSDGTAYIGRYGDDFWQGALSEIIIASGEIERREANSFARYVYPVQGNLYAQQIIGGIATTVHYWDGVTATYPDSPVEGQMHILYEKSTNTITKKVWIDGAWRDL